MIIVGYQCIGKSTLSNMCLKYIDLRIFLKVECLLEAQMRHKSEQKMIWKGNLKYQDTHREDGDHMETSTKANHKHQLQKQTGNQCFGQLSIWSRLDLHWPLVFLFDCQELHLIVLA